MPDSNSRIPASVHAILIAAVALLLWAYWPTWGDLFETWMSDPDYNHGFLVVPIAGWLLWQRRELLTGVTIRPSWWGLVFLLMAAGVRWVGAEFFFREFEAWSIPFWLGGVVLLFGGWQLLRWSAGSIAFLWFMTPLPLSFTNFITLPLQKASAVLSTWTLHLFAQPAVLRGTTISLGDQMLDVERACSGLRICYGTLALSVAYVVLTRPRLYKSVLLIGASVPLAIVANSTRVTLTGLLFQVVSGEKAHGIAHDFSGLLMLPMAVFLLWLFHLCIDRVVAAFGRSSYQGSLLILKSVVVIAVIGTGLVLWQMKQSDAAVTTLLQTAERHETAGRQFEADEQLEDAAREYSKAAGVLSHFCSLRPEDADATERLAAAAEKLAFTRTNRIRATRLYQAAWELAPDNSELGFKTARLAVMAELYKDAITASETLLQMLDGDTDQKLEAFRLKRLAMSRDAESDAASRTTWDELAAVMQTGLEDELDPVSCGYQLAILYREKPLRNVAPDERSAAAADILDKLVADYAQDPLAWFARYSYRRAYPLTASADSETVTQKETPPAPDPGSSDSAAAGSEPTPASTSATPVAQDTSADSDLDKAIELAAESKDESLHPIWLAAGDRAVLRKNYPEAEAFYSKATTVAPGHFRAYLQLARLATDPQISADSDGAVPPQQRLVAIETLKRALTQDNLAGEVLLRVELIRQQLRSDDAAQITEAEQQIDRLKTQFSEFPPELGAPLLLNLAIAEAECYADLEQPGKAATVLRQALKQEQVLTISGRDGLLSNSWLLLGSCYEKQGNTDEAQQCFDRAIELEPSSVESLWYQAFSAERANSTNDAIDLYRDIADRLGNRPEPWIAVARNELRRQQQLAPNRRDPSEILRALERARAAGASAPALAVIEADLWLMNDDAAKALAVLEQVAADNPDNTDIWRRLAAVHLRNGDQAASTEALKRFRELSTDDPGAAVLLEASLLVDRNMVDEARQLLDQAVTDAVDPEVQRTLVDYYVQLEVTTADLDKAQLLLTEFTDRHPDDVTGLRRLAEFLWGRRDMQRLQQAEQQLRQAEGEGGMYWQELRARRLLQTAMQTTDPVEQKKLVDEARRITEQIKTSPGMQTATLLLQGRLAGLDGRYGEAAAFFESAWNKAPGSGALASELVFSLMAAGDRTKADRFLQEVGSGVLRSPQLFDMALELRSGVVVNDLRQATGVAREWTQSVGDADSHLRLARVLSLDISPPSIPAEKLTELESAYRTALELDPSAPQTWGEFLRFLFRVKAAPAEGTAELNGLLVNEQVTPLDRAYLAARLLTELNARGPASRLWHQAVDLAGEQINQQIQHRVLNSAAEFFLPSDSELSEQFSRRALTLQPDDRISQRLLLTALALTNTPDSLRKAEPILDFFRTLTQPLSSDEKRATGLLLYRRATLLPDEDNAQDDLREASSLLSTVSDMRESDALLLAQITGRQGNHQAAVLALSDAAARSSASVAAIRTFVEYWQDHLADSGPLQNRIDSALTKLEQTEGAEVVSLELRLRPDGVTDEQALKLTQDFLASLTTKYSEPERRNAILRSVFAMLFRTNQHKLAFMVNAADITGYSAEQKITALVSVATASPANPEFDKQLQNLLSTELTELESQTANRAAADYYYMRAKWDQAESLYRWCLERNPADLSVANNLALVVAEHHQDFDEANRLLQQAESTDDNNSVNAASVLDTKAWLLMKSGNPEAAYQIFRDMAKTVEADATTYLHLAECARLLGKQNESEAAMVIARQMGIADALLPASEQQLYAALSGGSAE